MYYWRVLCACAALLMLSACDVPNAEIKGKVTYEKIPHSATTNGLAYSKSFDAPIRGVQVELIEDNKIIATDITNIQGQFKFIKKMDTFVKIRVRSELINGSNDDDANSWNVKVADNTRDQAVYVLSTETFEVKRESMTIDLHAPSGWIEGKGYAQTRAAAPFHILDKIYDILSKLDTIGNVELPALTVNWSPNNIPQFGDITTGKIGTSYYTNNQIFLLGAENIDTDEYDQHVIIHEWGHFFEDNLSRSDSIGGIHAGGDHLDMRVAFGEGFGNAWSAMITDKPLYQDAFDADQATGFSIPIDDNDVINAGWYSEGSVQSLLYDLYDEAADGQDFVNLGLAPIVDILKNQQKDTEAFTSIFSFMTFIKQNHPEFVGDFDKLMAAQNINPDVDIWGSNADNDGSLPEALPIYLEMNPGDAKRLCTSTSQGDYGNKLANHRYLKLKVPSSGSYTVTLTPSRNNDLDGYIFTKGQEIAKDESPGIAPINLTVELPQGHSIVDTIAYNEEGVNVVAACFEAKFNMN